MQVHNVHSRELAASPERVGAVLDSLGGEEDRLWPVDRWPAMPFQLDGPLAVGSRARHGPIPYAVEEYEPGRRLVFRFASGLGLDGTHRFEVEPLGADRSRLTHTLECAVKPKMLALWPIVRGYHDALLEDLLDRAELAATGRHRRARRRPLWLRLANGTEVRLARRRGKLPASTPRSPAEPGPAFDRLARLCAIAVPAALGAIAAIHAAWALGWRWPGGNDREFAERILGYGATEVPPAAASWAVAVALLGAAAIVAKAAAGPPSRGLEVATWGVAGVLLARGAISIPVDLIRGFDQIYERLDLAIYSPLCLALGTGTAIVARRAAEAGRAVSEPVTAGAAGSLASAPRCRARPRSRTAHGRAGERGP